MTRGRSTQWWAEKAARFGLIMIDHTAFESKRDWEDVLRSGEAEIWNAFQKTAMPSGEDLKLLEIGCGVGRLSFALAQYFGYVHGVDVAPEFIRIAQIHNSKRNLKFSEIKEDRLFPGKKECFDVIFSMEVFHYLDKQTIKSYISDSHRLLKKGGTLVFQANTTHFTPLTKLSLSIRFLLNCLGVSLWRGIPTDLASNRKQIKAQLIVDTLRKAGFRVLALKEPNTTQTWFVSRK